MMLNIFSCGAWLFIYLPRWSITCPFLIEMFNFSLLICVNLLYILKRNSFFLSSLCLKIYHIFTQSLACLFIVTTPACGTERMHTEMCLPVSCSCTNITTNTITYTVAIWAFCTTLVMLPVPRDELSQEGRHPGTCWHPATVNENAPQHCSCC